MNNMYSQIMLEHSKNKKNFREIENPTYIERGHNPSCGDDLTLLLKLDGQIIVDASFIGFGCAISKASMSIMIDLVKGKELKNALDVVDTFFKMMHEEEVEEEKLYSLGDAYLFESLKNVPARIKCATLGWHCLKVVLDKSKNAEV